MRLSAYVQQFQVIEVAVLIAKNKNGIQVLTYWLSVK
jgi:hypothetical protein